MSDSHFTLLVMYEGAVKKRFINWKKLFTDLNKHLELGIAV
ncbi:unnamed protein product [Rhodiola kirilowii]